MGNQISSEGTNINDIQSIDQQIVIFPANGNRNRFMEPSSLRIGIGIIFVRWEVFANYSRISEIYFFSYFCNNLFFLTLIYFSFVKLTRQKKHSEMYAHSLYIYFLN